MNLTTCLLTCWHSQLVKGLGHIRASIRRDERMGGSAIFEMTGGANRLGIVVNDILWREM